MNVIENGNQKIEETIKRLQDYQNIMNNVLKSDNTPDVEKLLNTLYSHTVTQIFEYVMRVTSHCKTN